MAFVVEDGTGLLDATSYETVAAFKAYHADRGVDLSSFTDPGDFETALIVATDYVDTRFCFVGTKKSRDQALEWPRIVDLLDDDGFDFEPVPDKLKRGVIIYALEALYGGLFPSNLTGVPGSAPGAGSATAVTAAVRRLSRQVGPLRRSVEYAVSTTSVGSSITRKIPQADLLLKDLVTTRSLDVQRA